VADAITHLQIEPTNKCNLQCKYCVGRKASSQGRLSLRLFDSILKSTPAARYVDLHGEGEPTLHPGLPAMLTKVRSIGIKVGFITNGVLLTKGLAGTIVDVGVGSVGISLDTVDSQISSELRGVDVQVPIGAAQILLSHRDDPQHPDVYFCAVLLRTTFGRFSELVSLSRDLGMSPPSAQALQGKPDYAVHYPAELDCESISEAQSDWLRDYLRRRSLQRRERGLRTYYEDLFSGREHEPCPFVRSSLYVRYDGEVFPCCFCQSKEASFGRAEDDVGIDAVTHSSRRLATIAVFENGGIPDTCRGCWVPHRNAEDGKVEKPDAL